MKLDEEILKGKQYIDTRRSREEREVVERAKERLMARSGMTEEEAHRALRRRSMDRRIPLADAARMLLDGERPAP